MRTTSLRTRLLGVTVGLVALGLIGAGVATYALLRASLVSRVDEQLRGSQLQAARALLEPERPFDRGGPRNNGGGAPVTYAVVLDGKGHVLVARSFGFGSEQSPPKLPADLPGSTAHTAAGHSRVFTADAQDGAFRYRVLATALPVRDGTIVVAAPLQDVESTLGRLLWLEGLVGAVVLAAAAGLALWLVRLGFKPLVDIENTAADIAAGNLSRRVEPADEHTEIGRLGRALNAMLEKIEGAFRERGASEERLRRFVADASHELRTPLTSIRGYAELFRRGADVRPDDLAKSMRRIEEEAERMGTLVEELLLLARLDEGRPLERAPVDLSRIAADAVHDARATQPSRPIHLDAADPVVVGGDEARLRQVAANLLSNALTHTPERTSVRVRVARNGDYAALEVADDGPGMDEAHAARIFDRFFRADPARSREKGNVGLGLSIVSAIVGAHGGHVAVRTAPGAGSTFLVTLPVQKTA